MGQAGNEELADLRRRLTVEMLLYMQAKRSLEMRKGLKVGWSQESQDMLSVEG